MNAVTTLQEWDSFLDAFSEVIFWERMIALDLKPLCPVGFLTEDLDAMLCSTIAALKAANAVRREFQA